MREPTHIITEGRESYIQRKNREADLNFFAVAMVLVVVGILLLIFEAVDKIKEARSYEQEKANWEQMRASNPILPESPPPKVSFERTNKFNVGISMLIIGIVFLLALKFLKRKS